MRNGGRAFPVPYTVSKDDLNALKCREAGMSLRDYFAGQALVGILVVDANNPDKTWEDITGACYFVADAMLAEREKK